MIGGVSVRALNRELTSQYELNIKKYQYTRSNYYLETNKGRFVLRKVELPKEQILFNYEVGLHLVQNGFSDFNNIYTTKYKLPYAMVGDQCYIMQTYIPAEETDFKNCDDLKSMIMALGGFHKAARGVESKIKDVDQVKIKNIYSYYLKRRVENTKLKRNIASLKQKSNFELLFLDGCEQYRELEELALGSISEELVERIITMTREDKRVAHKDYMYHAVNRTENNQYMITKIDFCNYDIQMLDLAQILNKIMQKNDWSGNLLYQLIENYNNINQMGEDEFRLLKFMMIYPEKYNSISFKYISSKRRWNYSMFEQKWKKMLTYKENQLETAKMINSW